MSGKIYLYILVCAAVSFLIRELPLTLIRKPIKSRFLRSFLFYVPYVTLAVMTFPSIVHATNSPIAGLAALVLGIAAAWFGRRLLRRRAGTGIFPVIIAERRARTGAACAKPNMK